MERLDDFQKKLQDFRVEYRKWKMWLRISFCGMSLLFVLWMLAIVSVVTKIDNNIRLIGTNISLSVEICALLVIGLGCMFVFFVIGVTWIAGQVERSGTKTEVKL